MAEPARTTSAPTQLEVALGALGAGPTLVADQAAAELAAWHPARLRRVWPRIEPALSDALGSGRLSYSQAVLSLLAKAGPAGQTLASEGLAAEAPEDRARVAGWLVARGEQGLRVVIAALPGLAGQDPAPVRIVLQDLAQRQADGDPAGRAQVARLLLLVAETTFGQRSDQGLVQVVPQGLAQALERLAELSGDPDPGVRIAALEALGELGQRATGAVHRVTERLHDPVPGVVEVAGEVLHRFGPEAIGPLRSVQEDPQAHLRALAARALGRLGQDWPGAPERMAARCLAASARDSDRAVRREAYQALAGMPAHAETDGLLAAGLVDPVPAVRVEVAALLGRREENPWAVRALTDALADNLATDGEPLALATLDALGKHGRDAQGSFGVLARAARRGPDRVRAKALDVILSAGGHPKPTLNLLAERLGDPASSVREAAVIGLGKRLPVEIKMHPRDRRLRRLAQRIRRMGQEDPDVDVRRVCRSLDVRLPQ